MTLSSKIAPSPFALVAPRLSHSQATRPPSAMLTKVDDGNGAVGRIAKAPSARRADDGFSGGAVKKIAVGDDDVTCAAEPDVATGYCTCIYDSDSRPAGAKRLIGLTEREAGISVQVHAVDRDVAYEIEVAVLTHAASGVHPRRG